MFRPRRATPHLTALLLTALLGCGSSDGSAEDEASSPGATTGAGAGAGAGVGVGGAASSTGSSSSGASGAQGGAASSGGGGSGGEPPTCMAVPACDAPPPPPGAKIDWKHTSSSLTVLAGAANHRGRDLVLAPGDEQWILGKFAYGVIDKDLKDEQVDVWLLRDCGSSWELLGTTSTTEENAHATVEGVEDSGGRVYFQIPPDAALGPGRHRAHLVVRGDLSTTDVFIEVLAPGAPVFVSDIDGTLTTTETEEFTALLSGALPDVNVDAPAAFQALADKGYRPVYVSARPELLVQRSRDFLALHGFPPGIVHTTLALGATGAAAVDFKSGELEDLSGKGAAVQWAFGNTDTDAEAYDSAGVQPLDRRVFYQFDDTLYGGRTIQAYTELLAEIAALPPVCN
ncbi:MAG: phosphatase domain-containing protein [Polyangiaceae bacterium]